MNTKLLFVLAICLTSVSVYAQQAPFITTWNTANPGTSNDHQITIPTQGTGYDYDVYWEDVDNATINGNITGLTGGTTITFPAPGIYRVKITGDFPQIYFNNYFANRVGGDKEKILTVEQWGDIAWTSMEAAFFGCTNLRVPAIDAPDLSRVTSMFRMFRNATSFNEDIGHWDVSNITDMAGLFAYARAFNQDIGSWNVSKVTDMNNMFFWASAFNQDISGWDVSNVTAMNSMFYLAKAFNQDIGGWNVGSVANMSNMFTSADSFQQHIGNWNVGNVTDMSNMFSGSPFNQDIGSWDVSNVTDMGYMFSSASFNQDISAWDVSSVENMRYMFYHADNFNQDIGNWDVSGVTNMRGMFSNSIFNQNLENWNVSNVTDMGWMFSYVALSLCNYDALLMGWAKLSLQKNVNFDAGNTNYSSEASAARQSIIDDFSWNIQDKDGIKFEISIVNEISCPGQADGVLQVFFMRSMTAFCTISFQKIKYPMAGTLRRGNIWGAKLLLPGWLPAPIY